MKILFTRFRAASGGPRLSFGFEEAFKEGNFSKMFFSIFEILKFYIFLVISWSWGVHRSPWFQNLSINIARTEVHTHTWIALYHIDSWRWSYCLGSLAQWLRRLPQGGTNFYHLLVLLKMRLLTKTRHFQTLTLWSSNTIKILSNFALAIANWSISMSCNLEDIKKN